MSSYPRERGVPDRRDAQPVADRGVGARFDRQSHRGEVIWAAAAEHDRFDQRGPTEIIDVIQRRAAGDQTSDDVEMTMTIGPTL